MSHRDLRQKYLDFFASKGHKIIPSASLVPENDPTTLFTSSGMQPLVPYLLGQTHPVGKRLVDSQKSFRSQDIEEVGNNRHTTFFEMLGNWSLGDYFKKDQLSWFFEFLTTVVGLDPQKLYVTVFSGDPETQVPKDEESIEIWKQLFKNKGIEANEVELITEEQGSAIGMQNGRIFSYGVKKNWWSRSGVPSNMPVGEPGGPDSEVFFDFGTPHDEKYGKHCHPNCDCGRFMEIGNSVFMQYQKMEDGSLKELSQKNVDFGGGLERILAAENKDPDVFKTDLFSKTIEEIKKITGKEYDNSNKQSMRVIADHLKAAIFLINDGVIPSNKLQGYVLRRLIRRTLVKMNLLGSSNSEDLFIIANQAIIPTYENVYDLNREMIIKILKEETEKFSKTLDKGIKLIDKVSPFDLYQTYGFPIEITIELLKEQNKSIDVEKYKKDFEQHQELSRTASKGMFKGGLADHSEIITKYHTATHLLQASLRKVIGESVHQEGSNITDERLRFDFSHKEKLTDEQINEVENLVNEQIEKDLKMTVKTTTYDEAIKSGALAFFKERYPDKVTMYSFGDFSKEICGGPHVDSTKTLGKFKIIKQESISAGIRRIYAKLES